MFEIYKLLISNPFFENFRTWLYFVTKMMCVIQAIHVYGFMIIYYLLLIHLCIMHYLYLLLLLITITDYLLLITYILFSKYYVKSLKKVQAVPEYMVCFRGRFWFVWVPLLLSNQNHSKISHWFPKSGLKWLIHDTEYSNLREARWE